MAKLTFSRLSQVHTIVAEDSEDIAFFLRLGLVHFIGIKASNHHQFEELDAAQNFIEFEHNRSVPTVVILDNNTPRSGWSGYRLAMDLLRKKEEFPNLIIVTISSSDMGLVEKDDGALIVNLRKLGGEFWAKHAERNLMLLWLGDCLRKKEMISRDDWLTSLGMETRYRSTIEDKSKEEWVLFKLYDQIYMSGEEAVDQVLKSYRLQRGFAFACEPREVLRTLGAEVGGEGNHYSANFRK